MMRFVQLFPSTQRDAQARVGAGDVAVAVVSHLHAAAMPATLRTTKRINPCWTPGGLSVEGMT